MDYRDRYDVDGILTDFNDGMSYRGMSGKWGVAVNTIRKIISESNEYKQRVIEDIVNQVYPLCTSKEGILESDEYRIVQSAPVKDIKKKVRRQCRERAKKEGKECLFIPDWMGRQAARANRDKMMQLAHELNLRIEESIYDFMQETGYSDYKNIHYVLCQLAVSGYSPASITEVCVRYEKTIEQIENV